jgi:amino acid adenylation domain-containing protein
VSKTIIKSDIEDTYALSSMQQGMLFQYQMAPESGYYIQQLVCSFRENLNVDAFKKAWEGILGRYQVLRTAFRWEGLEEPRQDVYIKVELPFETQDWQHLSADRQQSQFREFLKADRKRVFNLTETPLLRLSLIHLGDASYRFVWTYHHIILDGTSRRVILEELFAIYDAIRRGETPNLPPTIPYRDYIDWSQQQDTSKSEGYWRELLRGYNPAPIGSTQTIGYLESEREYAEIQASLPKEVTESLRALASENQLTLNAIVQGAWALLLSRYSGEDDVIFGEVRAGRHWTSDKAKSMVGLFIHTVPMRVQVRPEAKLLPWLREIRQSATARREHENTPLIQIQGWSGVPRGMSLFESLYVYDNYHLNTRMRSKGDDWQNREFRLIEDNGFPITIDIYAESELIIKITCEKHRFDNADVKSMLGHLKRLLEGIAADADRPLAEFPMLTDAERRQILVEWNDTRVDYPQDKLIHQIFEAQAEKMPDSTAVVFEGESLTYRELNQRANQLAHYLKSNGVGPESLVGIAVERSLEMIVGLYGILKAGGAYVPLDPTYPAERVAYMMEAANVPVLLTQQGLLERIPPSKARVVCLDTDWESLIASQSTENPTCEAKLENLAYVIYTSGSTGKPKGAMNTHGSILNRLLWMQDAYRLNSEDAVLQKTPFSFDVSVWEFFWPLMFGARLVVARPEGHKDSDYLIKTIIAERVTTMHFVPSMLQIFLMARDVEKCTSLRQVICSGEALTPELQKRFFTRLNAKLYNLYGPTEAAVDVTYWECQQESNLKTVPIGRPVANTQMYILDRNMQPVPVGIPGELYIGGVQVARGYYNRPELTAETFIPDPVRGDPKARLYKTGDSCRYLPDGNIEYLGRLDFQVKIRGNRIELGEIEALLGQHPAVREVVVTAREDTPGDLRLVAYIVFHQNQAVSSGELREYVKQKLPDFMVPSFFVTLDKLPLTPNQKIDRKALPAPEKGKTGSEGAYVPPKNELQRTIAGIWQAVLNVPEVSMNDNFFELGGHSLLLVQAYYRIHEITDKELTMTDLFKYPTISALAEYLSRDTSVEDHSFMEGSVKRAEARRKAIQQRQRVRQKTR